MNRKIIDRVATISLPLVVALVAMYIYFIGPLFNPSPINNNGIVTPLYNDIASLELNYPLIATILSLFLIIFGAVLNLFTTTRYNLFGTAMQLPMVIYVYILLGFTTSHNTLCISMAACLGVLALRDFFYTYEKNGRNSKLFSACIWLGTLSLIYPSTVLLWAAGFIFLILFVKSMREVIVVVSGLLLPLIISSYVRWLFGGDFLSDISIIFTSVFTTASGWSHASIHPIILISLFLLLTLFSLMQIERMSLRYATRIRIYCVFILVASGGVMSLLPSFCIESLVALSAPLSIVVTPAMMRLRSWISIPLYIIILLLTITIFIPYFMK